MQWIGQNGESRVVCVHQKSFACSRLGEGDYASFYFLSWSEVCMDGSTIVREYPTSFYPLRR